MGPGPWGASCPGGGLPGACGTYCTQEAARSPCARYGGARGVRYGGPGAHGTEGPGRTVWRARGVRYGGPGAHSMEGPGRTVRRPAGYVSACSVLEVE